MRAMSCSGASSSSTSAAVEICLPRPYFTGTGSPISSNKTLPNCCGELMLNCRPASSQISPARRWMSSSIRTPSDFNAPGSTRIPDALHAPQHARQRQIDLVVQLAQALLVHLRREFLEHRHALLPPPAPDPPAVCDSGISRPASRRCIPTDPRTAETHTASRRDRSRAAGRPTSSSAATVDLMSCASFCRAAAQQRHHARRWTIPFPPPPRDPSRRARRTLPRPASDPRRAAPTTASTASAGMPAAHSSIAAALSSTA